MRLRATAPGSGVAQRAASLPWLPKGLGATVDDMNCCSPKFAIRPHANHRSERSAPRVPETIRSIPDSEQFRRHKRNAGHIHQLQIPQRSIPAGSFTMGDPFHEGYTQDGEHLVHDVEVDAFVIDATAVTNAAFAQFVESTGYVSEAERFGYSAVFHLLLAAEPEDVLGRPPQTPWWYGVAGADWRRPHGPQSNIRNLADHP